MRRNRPYGHVRPATAQQLQEYAERLHFTLDDALADELAPIMAEMITAFDEIDELPQPPAPGTAFTTRDVGREPTLEEDPFNAFIRFCRVEGATDGSLAGLTASIKDCIAIAGMPTTNGSRMQPTAVPGDDAVVVERILAAGATIVGKNNLEDMAMGTGEGSVYGPALNPTNPDHGTGGSSTGSAAAVAAGMVDFSLGADEAGSVRIPSAMCGLVGMKATHGLVPTYGLTYFDHTLDHIGPLTRDIELNARVLEVLAGPDWRDPQWTRGVPEPGSFTEQLDEGVQGLRFAVVEESLEPNGTTPDVLSAFNEGLRVLESHGAVIERVSVPLWGSAWSIESAILSFTLRAMADSGGAGYFHKGRIDPAMTAAMATQVRTSFNDLAVQSRLSFLLGEHMREEYLGVHYAKAHNLRLELGQQVDAALHDRAALLTPTVPVVAPKLSRERHSFTGMLPRLGGPSVLNTCATDLTGHPALTVPTGSGDHGLPVGLQLIGQSFDESTLYRAGAVLEEAELWRLPEEPTAPVLS
ncbi:amidase family protein [Citricoccus sp. GCM10030269]|uniref:amidase family protein n=1 Tax=Citricoccus sp. GCM10030269 TaxID=3273388 RepID=UPI00361F829D